MIDRQKMREAAEKATPGEWDPKLHNGPSGFDIYPEHGREIGVKICRVGRGVDAVYIAAAQPRNIIAILDRLDMLEGMLKRAGEALAPIAKRASEIPVYARGDELVPAAWPLTNTAIRAVRAIAQEIEETLK